MLGPSEKRVILNVVGSKANGTLHQGDSKRRKCRGAPSAPKQKTWEGLVECSPPPVPGQALSSQADFSKELLKNKPDSENHFQTLWGLFLACLGSRVEGILSLMKDGQASKLNLTAHTQKLYKAGGVSSCGSV
jgi:hypothetical protein